jgi:hypothetical protein
MMSFFPALFDFSLFAVFVLRVTAGIFFWVFGVRLLQAAYGVRGRGFMVSALGFSYGFAKLVVGLLLTVGILTQVGALIGMALSVLTFLQGMGTHTNKSSQQVQVLLFAMCLSLLFLGPGIFAVDFPL